MFGGWGFYVDGLFIALVAFDRLYLKGDAGSQAAFSDAGCEPFCYRSGDKAVTMGYWTAPAEAMESPAMMAPWARRALQAALAARAAAALKPARAARKSPAAAGAAAVAKTPRPAAATTSAAKPAAKARRR